MSVIAGVHNNGVSARRELTVVGNLTGNEALPVRHLTINKNVGQRSQAKGFHNPFFLKRWPVDPLASEKLPGVLLLLTSK